MRPQDIIRKKRDREQLLPAEINFFIDGVTHGQIADYQISALLMAIYLVFSLAIALVTNLVNRRLTLKGRR